MDHGLQMHSTIDGHAVPVVMDCLARSGIDPGDAGDDPPASSAQPPEAELRLFVNLLEQAAARARGRAAIWDVGRRFAPTFLDALFPEVWRARRLGDLLGLVADSLQGVQTGTHVSLDIADGVALYSYRILDPTIWPRTRDAEFTLGFILGAVQFALGDAIEPHGIMFEHDPEAHGGRLDRFVGQACVYGETDNAIAFPAGMLDAPVFASRGCGTAREPRVPDAAVSERPLVEQVEACVLGRIGHGRIDQDAIAADLGLSARSLRRRLAEEGAGYRAVIDRARMAYAINMLRGTAMPVLEIARRLDYDSLSAFSRAFHFHSGQPPSALRRRAEV